jgi:CheY-like chemotaxis protein
MSIPSISLIEDNEGDVLLIRKAFDACSSAYNLKVFTEGDHALEYFMGLGNDRLNWPDLIMLDYNMPKTHGLKILQHLKENELLRVIPVIIYSSSDYHMDIYNAYNSYVNSYIIKPGNIEDFCSSINMIWKYWFHIVRLPNNRIFV